MNEFSEMSGEIAIFVLLMIFVIITIQSYLIMIIWNNVIIKKFPDSNIQELSFWDALGIMVLFSILIPNTIIYSNKFCKNLK